MHIDVLTPAQAVEAAAQLCLRSGSLYSPRAMPTYEHTNVTLQVEEPWHLPFTLEGRELRPFIGAVEALQLVGQVSSPELVVRGSKPFVKFLDDGTFHGAYGPRIHGRLATVVHQLKKDPQSRQAVLTIFDSRQDLGARVSDVPCTLSVQFLIREGAVCARTSMRSNDVWLGLPYDLVQFIALQAAVAAALNLPVGWYAHTVGSLHLYRQNEHAAESLRAESTELRPYAPLWSPGSIGDISARARLILADRVERSSTTAFESWLIDAVSRYA